MKLIPFAQRAVTAASALVLVAGCTSAPAAPTAAPSSPTTAPAAVPTSAPAPVSAAASPAVAVSQAASPVAAVSPAAVPSVAAAASPGAAAAPAVVPSPPPAGSLVEASLAALSKTLHPFPDSSSYTQSWIDAANLIWGGSGGGALVQFDWTSLDWKPAMADLPTISEDGKTFTFKLHSGLKWSDGSPITVDDFLYAWQNASNPANDYVGLDDLQEIDSFTAPDANTIVATMKDVHPRDVALGKITEVTPIPSKVWQGKAWNDTSSNPEILKPSVVLGPYTIQDFRIAEHAQFSAVNTYYAGQPKIPTVEILPNQQPTVAFEQLRSGRANWAPNIPPAQYTDAKNDPNLTMYQWTAANASYRTIEFNLTRQPLSDHAFREALARAINRDDLIQVAENNLGSPQYSFLNPNNTKWVNPNVQHYDTDLNQAKQLLSGAGYTLQNNQLMGKDGKPISLDVVYPTSSAPRGKIATYLQQAWKDLGVTVNVRGLDFNAYTDVVSKQKNFDVSLGTYGGGSLDPDLGPRNQLISNGTQNVTGYANDQVDQLFKQAGVELDDTQRKQMYDQIQTIVADDLPQMYLYALVSFSPASKKVQGIQPSKGDRLDYSDAILQWSVTQ